MKVTYNCYGLGVEGQGQIYLESYSQNSEKGNVYQATCNAAVNMNGN